MGRLILVLLIGILLCRCGTSHSEEISDVLMIHEEMAKNNQQPGQKIQNINVNGYNSNFTYQQIRQQTASDNFLNKNVSNYLIPPPPPADQPTQIAHNHSHNGLLQTRREMNPNNSSLINNGHQFQVFSNHNPHLMASASRNHHQPLQPRMGSANYLNSSRQIININPNQSHNNMLPYPNHNGPIQFHHRHLPINQMNQQNSQPLLEKKLNVNNNNNNNNNSTYLLNSSLNSSNQKISQNSRQKSDDNSPSLPKLTEENYINMASGTGPHGTLASSSLSTSRADQSNCNQMEPSNGNSSPIIENGDVIIRDSNYVMQPGSNMVTHVL